MYIRIQYIKQFGVSGYHENLKADTYVFDYPPEYGILSIMEHLYTYGFTRATGKADYDPELRISPGAILSVVPCDEKGYSKHDRERIAREEEVRRRG